MGIKFNYKELKGGSKMLIGIILAILLIICMKINEMVFDEYCQQEEEYFKKKYENIQKNRF